MSHHDTVLYKKVGRAPAQPICSCDPNDPQLDALFKATQQHHISDAIRSGSQLPQFTIVPGDPNIGTEGAKAPTKTDSGKDAKPKG